MTESKKRSPTQPSTANDVDPPASAAAAPKAEGSLEPTRGDLSAAGGGAGSVRDLIRDSLIAKGSQEEQIQPPLPPVSGPTPFQPLGEVSILGGLANLIRTRRERVAPVQLNIFLRQLTVLLSAGIPLMRSLQILAARAQNEDLRRCLNTVMEDVGKGNQFWAALARHPRYFNKMTVNVVRTGEESGSLVKVMDYLASYRDREAETIRSLQKAVTYPLLVLVMAIGVILVLLTMVIPTFAQEFRNTKMSLPWPSRVVFGMSDFATNRFLWFILIALVAYFVYVQVKRRGDLGHFLDRVRLKLPIFGPILINIYTVQFATMMSILLRAGVPLLKGLDLVRETMVNTVFKDAFGYIKGNVERGRTLAESFQPFRFLPVLVQDMIAVGEEVGRLPEVLDEVAAHHQREVDYQTAVVGTLVEPLLVAGMGIVVLFVALSMFLPYFQMVQVIAP